MLISVLHAQGGRDGELAGRDEPAVVHDREYPLIELSAYQPQRLGGDRVHDHHIGPPATLVSIVTGGRRMHTFTNLFVLVDMQSSFALGLLVVKRVYEALGQRIRMRREQQGLSQAKLAERVHLTRTSISNIENGRQHLPLHSLYRFADVLACRPHDLLPELEATAPVEEALASAAGREDVRRFLEKVRSLKG